VERKWKERYRQKFRRRAVARMNACENITRLSRELGVSRGLLEAQLNGGNDSEKAVASVNSGPYSSYRSDRATSERAIGTAA
jgi:transposase-like protein